MSRIRTEVPNKKFNLRCKNNETDMPVARQIL